MLSGSSRQFPDTRNASLSRTHSMSAVGTLVKLGVALAIAAALLVTGATFAGAQTTATTTCSTRGLRAATGGGRTSSPLSVVRLDAEGVSCSRAAGVARQVVADLAGGKPVSVNGAEGIDIVSSSACGGCASETQLSLTYPAGVVTIEVRGALPGSSGTGQLPSTPFPQFPDFPFPQVPTIPFPNGSGSTGGGTVV